MSDRKVGLIAKELIAAKKRIENPENWWDGKWNSGSRQTRMFTRCALTALSNFRATAALLESCVTLFKTDYVPMVNDELGHAAVMKLYDHAIQRALSEGK